jgi:hypothetical protein
MTEEVPFDSKEIDLFLILQPAKQPDIPAAPFAPRENFACEDLHCSVQLMKCGYARIIY